MTKILPPKKVFDSDPPGLRWLKLNQLIIELLTSGKGTLFASLYNDEVTRIADGFIKNNDLATSYEQTGEVDKAINIYENQVENWCDGDYPYDRLIIIYTNRGQLEEAIRVCKAFIQMANGLLEAGSPREDLRRKVGFYSKRIEKLATKLSEWHK